MASVEAVDVAAMTRPPDVLSVFEVMDVPAWKIMVFVGGGCIRISSPRAY